jgi:tRNA modification GTPase
MTDWVTTGSADTIYAEATMVGAAGVAIIRVSGPASGVILRGLTGRIPAPRVASYSKLVSPTDGEIIDHGLVLWFPGPGSFSGEDVAEFHVHGGRAVVACLVGAIREFSGVRLAEAGEFSRRAFMNGKLDLTEAEALADLVASETEAQRKQALRQLSGELGELYGLWRLRLLRGLARVEAELDFVDEGLPSDLLDVVRSDLSGLLGELDEHLDDGGRGEIVREGLRLVIGGPPNVGKSSLINLLCGKEISIVYQSEGTTRDIVEARAQFGGVQVSIADTAGIRSGAGEVEREGIRRANLAINSADIPILVFDASEYPELNVKALSLVRYPGFIVFNKIDKTSERQPSAIAGFPVRHVSCQTGEGIAELVESLNVQISGIMRHTEAPVLTRRRHREALVRCKNAIEHALEVRDTELVAEELRAASHALGRITGRVGVEDILDVIFAEFCIGK